MFNRNKQNHDENKDNVDIKQDLLNFLSKKEKSSAFDLEAAEKSFVKEDLKLRAMVVKTLEKEFGKKITQIKNYEYLVESVVNRLKKAQLGGDGCQNIE